MSKSGIASLLKKLTDNRLPTVGLLNAFPEAFGLSAGKGSAKKVLDADQTEAKIELLLKSGEESRLALERWRLLEERYLEQPDDTALWVEESALHLRQVVLLDDEDPLDFLDAPQSSEDRQAGAREAIDDLAAKVATSAPRGLFRHPGSGTGQPDSTPQDGDTAVQQLTELAKVICKEADIKQQPYEWVYDGLKPLLLDSVLEMRKGVHISLAALYCAVARRLSCRLLPEVATRTAAAGAPAGLSLAAAPSPDAWLLYVAGKRQDRQFLDPTTGRILNATECTEQYPTLDQAGSSTPISYWIGLVRTAMIAHQRRGDGDAVAHCMYQLMALDMQAPEWQTALQPPAFSRGY